MYLNEISRERMISPEEEAELGRKLHGKGAEAERAKERLVRANLRFVVSVAKQYQGRSLSLEDLINEGNIGLVKAVNHFDETRGFKFISYAVWWIRQSIIEAIGVKSRAVRVPLSAAGTASRIQRVTAGYLQEFGWSPSREELSDLTGLPLDVIDHGLHAITHTTSIDQPVADGSTVSVSYCLFFSFSAATTSVRLIAASASGIPALSRSTSKPSMAAVSCKLARRAAPM